ncbi:MAG TPA: SDR family NAD(P)-dependent oxidoreductase [Oligoflexia bacterium]|nr:SDR family NAD(P)-dependent oxidoreductase [Oligoflexia bacterium]HMP27015.1 SDR family NAD(P)-dependent oxidoreductase [Oligoflexia bacterium]
MKIAIFGAYSGIAKEVCRLYAQSEHDLCLVGRNLDSLEALRLDLIARGARSVLAIESNFRPDTDYNKLLLEIASQLGGLDLAIIAFGSLGNEYKANFDFSEARSIIEDNYISVVALTIPIAQFFEKQRSGKLAVITSVAGDRGRASNYTYGSAKAGLSTYLEGLRGRLFASGVGVLDIKPGFVDTPMVANFKKNFLFATPQRVARDIVKAIAGKRDLLYTPWFWRWIMLLIKLTPRCVYKRLKSRAGGLAKAIAIGFQFSLPIYWLIACAPPSGKVFKSELMISSVEVKAAEFAEDARAYFNSGRLAEAEINLRKAIYLDPKAENLKLNLIILLEKQGQYGEARSLANQLYQKALLEEDKLRSLIWKKRLALIDLAEGNYQKARFGFESIIAGYLEGNNFDGAAPVIRELANLDFILGEERLALCGSWKAVDFSNFSDEQVAKHLKLLTALGFAKANLEFLQHWRPEVNLEGFSPPILAALAFASFEEGYLETARFAAERALVSQVLEEHLVISLRALLRRLVPIDPELPNVILERYSNLQFAPVVKLYLPAIFLREIQSS